MQQVDHPNIVKYYETYEDKKFIYLCMELMTGGELIDKKNTVSEENAAFYFARVVKAIQHCNAQNIVHRDIKPENIMFDHDKQVKLIDFGFATVKGKKKLNDVVGTPYYIAPEIINEKPYSGECDMWSLGVVLYQYLTGTMPFDGDSIDQCFSAIKKGKF